MVSGVAQLRSSRRAVLIRPRMAGPPGCRAPSAHRGSVSGSPAPTPVTPRASRAHTLAHITARIVPTRRGTSRRSPRLTPPVRASSRGRGGHASLSDALTSDASRRGGVPASCNVRSVPQRLMATALTLTMRLMPSRVSSAATEPRNGARAARRVISLVAYIRHVTALVSRTILLLTVGVTPRTRLTRQSPSPSRSRLHQAPIHDGPSISRRIRHSLVTDARVLDGRTVRVPSAVLSISRGVRSSPRTPFLT